MTARTFFRAARRSSGSSARYSVTVVALLCMVESECSLASSGQPRP